MAHEWIAVSEQVKNKNHVGLFFWCSCDHSQAVCTERTNGQLEILRDGRLLLAPSR